MGGPPGGLPPVQVGTYAPPTATKKGGCGKAALVLGVVGVLVLAALGGVGYYFFGTTGTKVSSTAHTHLPKGCDVAIRLDLASLMKVKPVKKHVVAALEEVMKEEGGGRLAAFLVAARMNPKQDLRSMAACLNGVAVGKDPDYGVVIGGKLLDENGVVRALDRHDSAGELKSPKKKGKLLVLEDEEGMLISQSPDDAALLFAGDEDDLERIAAVGDDFETYDLPLDEHMVGVVSPKAVKDLLGGLGPLMPGTERLQAVGKVVITMSLDPGELGFELTFPDAATAAQAKSELEGALGTLALAPFGPTAAPEVKKALRNTKVKTQGKRVVVSTPLADASIEATCEELADKIREQNK